MAISAEKQVKGSTPTDQPTDEERTSIFMDAIRFNIVTGKGGVGKTLVSILNGIQSAKRGRKTLICELNTSESVSALLGTPESNGQIISVSEDLSVVNIRPDEALMEYANLKLRVPSLSRLVFDNPLVRALTEFVPGMSDLLMLGKAFNHERETQKDGSKSWDQIIVDAPATGHGITFLNLPDVISSAIPTGNMHEEAVLMSALLRDPTRTRIDVVTTPEPLPVQETIQLCDRLQKELSMTVGRLYVNRCINSKIDANTRNAILQMNNQTNPCIDWLKEEFIHISAVESHVQRLQSLSIPMQIIPEIPSLLRGNLNTTEMDILVEAANS